MKRKAIVAIAVLTLAVCLFVACDGKNTKPVKLTAPELTVQGNSVSWNAVEYASEYEVFVNGVSVGKQAQTEYTLVETTVGTYKVSVKAVAVSENYLDSDLSTETEIIIAAVKLATPSVSAEGNVFSWQAVENADGYEVFVDGVSQGIQTETDYTFVPEENKAYAVTVKAVSVSASYLDSDLSQAVMTQPRPDKLGTPAITVFGLTVSWQAIENARGYEIFVDGVSAGVQTETSYTLNPQEYKTYSVQVKAVSDTDDYVDSDLSFAVKITVEPKQLKVPVVSVDGLVFSWQAIENASGYEIFVDGVSAGVQTETSYTLNPQEYKTYSVQVKAVSDADDYIDSDLSVATIVTVEREKLNAPVIIADGPVFSWQAIENASGYEIFVDGVSAGVQTETSYTLMPKEFKIYTVQVKAVSESDDFVDSDLSNSEIYENVKPRLQTPELSVDKNVVSWTVTPDATSYKVYVDGVYIATVEETQYVVTKTGTFRIAVVAVSADPDEYDDSYMSDEKEVVYLAPVDLSKPLYAYSPHLEDRIGRKYVLGIADSGNYSQLDEAYQDTLDKYIDNYLCNMAVGDDWTDEDYAAYAWQLEEVSDYTGTIGVVANEKIYRIKLVDGTYLSVAKNNHIGTSGDYITSSVYCENDIWQYWQFVRVKDGNINDYYIYNVGHSYDWYAIRGNAVTDALTDTSRNDGGAELYPMDDSNKAYFVYTLVNVENAEFDSVKYEDYSGEYVLYNMNNKMTYGFDEGDPYLKQKGSYTGTEGAEEFVWTFEKTEYEGMHNVYRIKLADGKYLSYGAGYMYEARDLNIDTSTPEGQSQLFVLDPVHGVKGGFTIGHIFDGSFIDSNDGQMRYYALDGEGNGVYVMRQWNSIDYKNHISNIWIFNQV